MGCAQSSVDKPPNQPKDHSSLKSRKTDREKNRREQAEAEKEEKQKQEDDFTNNLLHERTLLSLHATFMMQLRGSYTDLLELALADAKLTNSITPMRYETSLCATLGRDALSCAAPALHLRCTCAAPALRCAAHALHCTALRCTCAFTNYG
jgi:hypothetical protein